MVRIKSDAVAKLEADIETVSNKSQAIYDSYKRKEINYQEYRKKADPLNAEYRILTLKLREEEAKNNRCLFQFKGKEYEGILIHHNCYSPDYDFERTDVSIIICPELHSVLREKVYSTRVGGGETTVEILYDFNT